MTDTHDDKERASFDAAFIRAIDRQAEMVAHTPGWKPLIDLVWEELAVTRSAGTRIDIDEPTAMLLAAISTACIQNTRNTAKQRINKGNPYWTQAYGDVCDAVDREMAQRERADKAEEELRTRSASERISEYTGFAVVMDDPNSAPEGFWWVGAWHHKATADEIAKKHGAASHVVQISSVAQRIGVKPISRLSCACEVNEDDTFIEKCALHSDIEHSQESNAAPSVPEEKN